MAIDVLLGSIASALSIYSEGKNLVNDLSKISGKKREEIKSLIDYSEDLASRTSKMGSFAYVGTRDLRSSVINPIIVNSDGQEFTLVNQVQFENIEDRQLMIVDQAGMGKSTSMKFIVTTLIKSPDYYPIFLELRKVNKVMDIETLICNEIFGEENADLYDRYLKNGKIIILLDGVDEIPLKIEEEVISKISKYCLDNPMSRVLVSGRPEDANVILENLPVYKIKPLSESEAKELLAKYDLSGSNSELLIKSLEGNPTIVEFLHNPLMVSLLYRAFDYRQTIPIKKASFYRQVYDSLFMDHDIRKGDAYKREKHSKLELDDFHKVTRALGFITFMKGELQYGKDAILKYISDTIGKCSDISDKPSEVLQDLYSTVPMLVKEGSQFRWSHKLLQEYFAAQYVCADLGSNTKNFFDELYSRRDQVYYRNFIDIIYDSNFNVFEEYFLFKYAQETIRFLQENLTQRGDLSAKITDHEIEERLSTIMDCDYYLIRLDMSIDSNDEKVTKYVDGLFDVIRTKNPTPIYSMSIYVSDTSFTVAKNQRRAYWMIKFLESKNHPIVSKHEIKSNQLGEVLGAKITYITHNQKNIQNSKANYHNTTMIIRRFSGKSINFKECRRIIREVEQKSRNQSFFS